MYKVFEKLLERFKKTPTWTTREGKVLKITEMGRSHLRNVLILLLKKAKYLKVLGSYLTANISNLGDGALDCFNMEFENLLNRNWEVHPFDKISNKDCQEYLPDIFYSIRDELKRRKEDVKEFEFYKEEK